MAKTAAQRQAEYRKNRPSAGDDRNGERRLNTWLSTRAFLALGRLARHQGMAQRAVLEQIIIAADDAILAGLELDSPEWEKYFGN
jgi:hypothetical protein